MIPRLVPEILPLDAFCDRVAVVAVAGVGDSRSWIKHTANWTQYFLKDLVSLFNSEHWARTVASIVNSAVRGQNTIEFLFR